jgi:neutral amino acid transport system permease protein
LAVIGIAVTGSLLPSRADAEITTPEGVKGFVRNELKNDAGEVVREAVPGVKIVVTGAAGGAAVEATTDAEGNYEIPLPSGPGSYTITLDTSTLPDGITATDENPTERTVEITDENIRTVNFFVGKDLRERKSRWTLLPQAVFNGLFFGLIIAVCAVGLSLIYGTTGLSNFAHGEMVTFGAIITWVANQTWGLPLVLAGVIGVAAGVAGGYLFERGLWQPLRRKRTGLTSQMIVSIGLATFFVQLWTYTFGGRAKSYADFQQQTNPIDLGPVEFPPRVGASVLVCLVILVGVAYFLMKTRFGKAVRAVSDNPDLASTTGINTDRIIAIVWVIGGGLASVGGILLGLDQQVKFDSGAGLLLLMFAAITLGGLGSAFGALVGSLVIGLATEVWAWVFPTLSDLKRVGALAALIVVLLVRPQGILGRKERIG